MRLGSDGGRVKCMRFGFGRIGKFTVAVVMVIMAGEVGIGCAKEKYMLPVAAMPVYTVKSSLNS